MHELTVSVTEMMLLSLIDKVSRSLSFGKFFKVVM